MRHVNITLFLTFLQATTTTSFLLSNPPPFQIKQKKHISYVKSSITALKSSQVDDDETVLENVTLQQLSDLCAQNSLSQTGSKSELLQRLRTHAEEEAERLKSRRIERLKEQGVHEYDEDTIEGSFFYTFGKENKTKTMQPPEEPRMKYVADIPPPNEKGERVVTVYSSTDENDLTGRSNFGVPNTNALGATSPPSPSSDTVLKSPTEKKSRQSKEFDQHVQTCTQFLESVMERTELPAYRDRYKATPPSTPFVGFDPNRHLQTEELNKVTSSLLYQGGEALQKSVEELEITAIGWDGMAADDVARGGGHYKTLHQIVTFLQGFRKAEVQKTTREYIQMMLESLVRGGVAELDQVLSTGGDAVLNEDMMQYLNDLIAAQEKRIFLRDKNLEKEHSLDVLNVDDLSNVTTINGELVETFDLSSPRLRDALLLQNNTNALVEDVRTGPEQLVNFLKLLRERLKVEAAYRGDPQQAQFLKLLAYCLRADTEQEREAIIWNALGKSLDKLDLFAQLVSSSIDYAESTSHQLTPSKSSPLDIRLLKRVHGQVTDLQKRQSAAASTGFFQ